MSLESSEFSVMTTESFPPAQVDGIQQASVPADRQANVPTDLMPPTYIAYVAPPVPSPALQHADESANVPAAIPVNSTARAPSSRRHSRGQKNRKHTAEPQEGRKLKQKRRQNKHYRWRRQHRRQGHQPPPPSPPDPSIMCLETVAQESVGAYVSFDEQDGVQPTQSDEQLAWQLHQELLLERQPRRAAARLARQVVCDLAGPDPSSSEEEGPESCPDSDGDELSNADSAQAPLVRAALRASSEETIQVGTIPTVVRIPALNGSHAATLVAAVVPNLGAQVSQAAMSSAWVPGLTVNGRRNQYVSQNFLHFNATSETSMTSVCVGNNKGGNSGTFRFNTEPWSPAFDDIAEQAAALRPEGSLHCPVNWLTGRLYAADGTGKHREHTDGYSWSFPDARYTDATPVYSVATATAAVSVTIGLVPCCSRLKDVPSVTLAFPETNCTDAHVFCLFSDQPDQGALRVRHQIDVHKSVRHSSLPRIALVFRSVLKFSGRSNIGLYDLRKASNSWLHSAMRLLMQLPMAAIAADLQAGTLGSKESSQFRALIVHSDVFGWPQSPMSRFLSVFSPPSANGRHEAGAILSAQPQLLKHFGYHSGNKGLSLGAIRVDGQWCASSLLLDFCRWKLLPSGALQGQSRYKNLLHPAANPSTVVCKGPDGDGLAAFFQIMETSASAGTPVRVLVKFSAVNPPPFVHGCPLDSNSGVYALGLAQVVSCHAHSSSFTLQLQDTGCDVIVESL
jgi:hypothetical protein